MDAQALAEQVCFLINRAWLFTRWNQSIDTRCVTALDIEGLRAEDLVADIHQSPGHSCWLEFKPVPAGSGIRVGADRMYGEFCTMMLPHSVQRKGRAIRTGVLKLK